MYNRPVTNCLQQSSDQHRQSRTAMKSVHQDIQLITQMLPRCNESVMKIALRDSVRKTEIKKNRMKKTNIISLAINLTINKIVLS